jgi:hypothetical protein
MATVKDYSKSWAWKKRLALFAVPPLLQRELQKKGGGQNALPF